MDIVTTPYQRKPIFVEAIQVTEENFEDVAIWCQGVINNKNGEPVMAEDNRLVINPRVQFISVRVQNPKTIRQTQAHLNDWILVTNTGFKVYTPTAFENSWERVE